MSEPLEVDAVAAVAAAGVDAAPVVAAARVKRARQKPKRVGKLRDAAPGRRGWQAKLYAPTKACRAHRVKFKAPATGEWVTREVPRDDDPDEYFDRLETQLSKSVEVGLASDGETRTMRALKLRYMAWLAPREIYYRVNVDNLLEKWVIRPSGDLLVENWGPEDSQRWLDAARAARLSPARIENLGVALSGMRKTAWRKSGGRRWLDPGEDPLEGVSFSRLATVEGAHRNYVAPTMRPKTADVESLIAEAEVDARWVWMPLQCRLGAFAGPRLGEQFALRDIDIDLVARKLKISHSVRFPRPKLGIPWALKPTKTGRGRLTPYPGTAHETLREACAVSLGLDRGASVEEVSAAQHRKRDAKFAALDEALTREGRPFEPDEGLLFVDPVTGLPPTKEIYGTEWRRIRARSTWPGHIPWRNARHHAATWWKRTMVDPSSGRAIGWEKVAQWLGNSHKTCLEHYVLAGEDDDELFRGLLDQL